MPNFHQQSPISDDLFTFLESARNAPAESILIYLFLLSNNNNERAAQPQDQVGRSACGNEFIVSGHPNIRTRGESGEGPTTNNYLQLINSPILSLSLLLLLRC